jgi:hypothetical protein
MRSNRVTNTESPETLSRRAIVAGIQREQDARRIESVARAKPIEQDAMLLRDETGVCWRLTINALGVLKTEAVKEAADASPPTRR